jgi:hypothetical protein
MSDKIYYVKLYTIFEDGAFLASFTRQTFRDVLSQFGRSSNWIGSILRLFLKKYPPPPVIYHGIDLERAVDRLGADGLAGYLRSKGFRVTKAIKNVSDEEIIA